MDMKAIFALAGDARRMSRVAHHIPKCMLEVAGKPILGYMIDSCLQNRIRDFIIIAKPEYRNMLKDYIQESYLSNGFEITTEYLHQSKVQGTGPAVQLALEDGYVEEPFITMWGDMLAYFDLPVEYDFAQMVVYAHGNCSHSKRFDQVYVSSDGRTKRIGKPGKSPFYRANSGIYFVNAYHDFRIRLAKWVDTMSKHDGELPIELFINNQCEDWYVMPKFVKMFIDVGTEEAYLDNKSFVERMMIR